MPNQRSILVSKSKCDEKNLFTANNLEALNEAAGRLISTGGFKLYMYIAKNQSNYRFSLSSKHFMEWSNLGYTAYTTAFNELVDKGYLIDKGNNCYIFYDKARNVSRSNIDNISVIYPEEKVKEIRNIKKKIIRSVSVH